MSITEAEVVDGLVYAHKVFCTVTKLAMSAMLTEWFETGHVKSLQDWRHIRGWA